MSFHEIVCDQCTKGDCEHCARGVHAFIDQDGPAWYTCECTCETRRLRKAKTDRMIADAFKAYRRECGDEALVARLRAELEGMN